MKQNQQTQTERLILASQSPRRRDLLEEAGIPIDIIPSHAEELLPPGEPPKVCAMALARLKAQEVAAENPDRWVLGADTIVVVDQTILGKPNSPEEAHRMLQTLSGQVHQVMTGFCLVNRQKGHDICDVVITEVVFKELSEAELSWYIKTGEPFDKAGGYGIQGKGASLVREIRGSYTNVVGLPVCEVVEQLQALNLVKRREEKE
ncbi:MAG: Maf family protein [Desulfobacterales bacterium]|nr:Maf family protein [Desulfobacterales bacterium]